MELLGKIARREGLGDILARGSVSAARHFGSDAVDSVAHVKGLDLPA